MKYTKYFFEKSTQTVGLAFYKPGRKCLIVVFKNNHWILGCYNKTIQLKIKL